MDRFRFLKQYGERRTGTNLLRARVGCAFPGTPVLMHVLGHKHGPPVDLDAVLEATRDAPDPALAFAIAATWPPDGRADFWRDNGALEHLAGMAAPLRLGCETGGLGVLISVRDPYTWAAAVAEWNGWVDAQGSFHPGILDSLRAACERSNALHRAWLQLAGQPGRRCALVRYEDLVGDPHSSMARIGEAFGLGEPAPCGPTLGRQVLPAFWDHLPERFGDAYEPERMRSRERPRTLPARLRDTVTATIDWRLMEPLGYRPEPAGEHGLAVTLVKPDPGR